MAHGASWKGLPALGSIHRNGDRIYGSAGAYAADLIKAGTPSVSNLRRATVTVRVQLVQVGQQLTVVRVGNRYEVRDSEGLVGHLSWGPIEVGKLDPRIGVPMPDVDGWTLVVERFTVSNAGEVVNLGGTITR
ncbi:hypothetical protein [Clavibacter nebraskensis]|uniref:hypothetical protein n=1 Tax=Clavibacter nebraskensis TaxID=31963 RepID=UPI00200F21E4|nr:hypothetical protein [Clavibacter nebraskensis]UQB14595.1 hypothetical protein LIX20_001217 [Clavibacter nebraskensis]UQB17427.1 hypothetical protein LIX22_001216 [Clavibacter nebraskensis]